MEKLVKLVAQKTGLSEEMARMAVELVLDYLKKEFARPGRSAD
jgi:nucleoid DNA-binding protein